MNTQLIPLLLSFILPALTSVAQTSACTYLYSRNKNETADSFVNRHISNYQYELQEHPIVEGYWGDESKGKKIIAFYTIYHDHHYQSGELLIFQPVGDGTNYVLSKTYLGHYERYNFGVISVFFMDVDENGSKELCVIQRGSNIDQELENVEENTQKESFFYRPEIIQQESTDTEHFFPFYRQHEIMYDPYRYNFHDVKNATEFKKAILEHYKD